MYTVLTIIIIVVCLFLVATVLMQNSKGGGLTQTFASQQQIMGVRKTTEFLEKVTWTLAASIMVLSFLSVMFIDNNVQSTTSGVDELLQEQPAPVSAPAFGTPVATPEAAAPAVEAPATEVPAAEAPAAE